MNLVSRAKNSEVCADQWSRRLRLLNTFRPRYRSQELGTVSIMRGVSLGKHVLRVLNMVARTTDGLRWVENDIHPSHSG